MLGQLGQVLLGTRRSERAGCAMELGLRRTTKYLVRGSKGISPVSRYGDKRVGVGIPRYIVFSVRVGRAVIVSTEPGVVESRPCIVYPGQTSKGPLIPGPG